MNKAVQTVYLNSPLGWLEINGNSTGILSVIFKEKKGKETKENNFVQEAKTQLIAYFNNELSEFKLKLSPSGTDFQKQVWKKLQTIKYGKTGTYLNIANALGDKNKVRAVGMANGKNPISIIIPCHRIIGSDGSLVGYAGGLDKKEKLLRLEGVINQTKLF